MPHTLNEFDGERSCPIPSPANARLRWCSIWSGMVRQSASRVRAGPGPACPPGLSRGTLFEQPDGIVALLRFGGVQQEDRGTGANFLHRGTAQGSFVSLGFPARRASPHWRAPVSSGASGPAASAMEIIRFVN